MAVQKIYSLARFIAIILLVNTIVACDASSPTDAKQLPDVASKANALQPTTPVAAETPKIVVQQKSSPVVEKKDSSYE